MNSASNLDFTAHPNLSLASGAIRGWDYNMASYGTESAAVAVDLGQGLGVTATGTVRARHVVGAMGTFFTPLFLRDNGIRNPWLGRNLSLHPAGAVTGHYPDVTFNHAQRIPQGFGVADLAGEGIQAEYLRRYPSGFRAGEAARLANAP